MADLEFNIRLKDINGNLQRVLNNFDAIFPGRTTETQKEWGQKIIIDYLTNKIREYEGQKAGNEAREAELAKAPPVFE